MNIIREASIDEVVVLNTFIDEFSNEVMDKPYFEKRLEGKKDVCFYIAEVNNIPAGYIVSYNKNEDNSQLYYCWLAAVLPNYRRQGVFTLMMDATKKYAQQKGYAQMGIKTKCKFKNMLIYLIQNDYRITDFRKEDGMITLEKDL